MKEGENCCYRRLPMRNDLIYTESCRSAPPFPIKTIRCTWCGVPRNSSPLKPSHKPDTSNMSARKILRTVLATFSTKTTRLYLWWNLCTLFLLACQVRVTLGDSDLCCCVCVMSFARSLAPLCADSARALWASSVLF